MGWFLEGCESKGNFFEHMVYNFSCLDADEINLMERKTDAQESTKIYPYTVKATFLWSHMVPLGNIINIPDSLN